MSNEYVILLHADESAWDAADEATRAATYEQHGTFAQLCEEHGHRITGGEELSGAATSTLVRVPVAGGAPVVSAGPFLETREQLGGFYTVATDDLDDLVALVAGLVGPGETAEIRPLVRAADRDGVDA